MKVSLRPTTRNIDFPLWAQCLTFIWIGSLAILEWLKQTYAIEGTLCTLRRFTGIACPTCGSTRMAYSVLEGNLYSAFLSNPLLFLTIIVFTSVLGLKLIFARKIEFELRQYEKIGFGLIGIAAFVANWIYIIIRDFET